MVDPGVYPDSGAEEELNRAADNLGLSRAEFDERLVRAVASVEEQFLTCARCSANVVRFTPKGAQLFVAGDDDPEVLKGLALSACQDFGWGIAYGDDREDLDSWRVLCPEHATKEELQQAADLRLVREGWPSAN